ncbi:restriction endonuclease [bacterium endosymbiont of Escarpia laminata]|nr:MAG: restriction endonuclease [bacterium endosymbiont of Escarpia laminata]
MSAEVNTPASRNPITDHLDIWSSVYVKKATTGRGSNGKISPYGIQKLRELILELAVQGKLVPQDPNHEPASVLLKKIAKEKVRLVKEGGIKKQKKTAGIADKDALFHCPAGWVWARLAQVAPMSLIDGDWIETKDQDPSGGIRLIQLADVGVDEFKDVSQKFVNEATYTKLKCTELEKGDVLIARLPNPIGRACLFPGLDQPAITVVDVAILRPLGFMHDRYLIHAINSTSFREQVESFGKGATRFRISTGNLKTILIPIPSLAEQHRIVAKVDELMALCDQLEQQQTDSLQVHQTLVETLLRTLVDAESTQQTWSRIAEHFDTLFTTEASIDQLKQTILQLAVMGRLVPQDLNDEPANGLLKKIAAENAKLVQEKKIKKHLPVEPFGDESELPNSWETIVVQDFADVRLGSTPSRTESKYWGGDIPWVSSGEVANCVIHDTKEKITQDGFDNSSVSLIPKRSVLIAIIGQGKTRGQSATLNIDACTNQNVAALVFNEDFVVPEFVWIWAKSKYESHRGEGRGGAQPALNGKKVRSFRFYLPPTAEQHRIVAKVDELMALCDALKARIQDAQTTQTHLADAIVEQAVA